MCVFVCVCRFMILLRDRMVITPYNHIVNFVYHNYAFQVMDRAITHADNVYNLSNVRITGQVCRTNIPPNTAFRGFGAPQAMLVSEHLMEDVATFLRLSPDKVSKIRDLSWDLGELFSIWKM